MGRPSRALNFITSPMMSVWSPAWWAAYLRHSNTAIHPSNMGTPSAFGVAFSPANPYISCANASLRARWEALKICTLNASACKKWSWRVDALAGDQRIKAGSSDRLAKLFAVIPIGPSSVCAVITVTPVANRPSASRNLRGACVGSK